MVKVKKRRLVIGVVLAIAVVISAFLVSSIAIGDIGSEEVDEEKDATVPWTCPTKSGSCSGSVWACDEDLDNTHACEYQCSGTTWGAGSECPFNLCNGGRCN